MGRLLGGSVNAIPIFGSEGQIPASIAGLGLEGVERYPDPRLGVMIRYGIPPWVKADAYLYDMGLSDIPGDLESPQVIELFQESLRGVTMAAEQGIYRDFEVLQSGYITLPPDAPEPLCLCASFAYTQNAGASVPVVFPDRTDTPVISDIGRLVSHMAFRTDRGYINKVRFNYPEDAGEGGFAGFLNFLVEWTKLVQTAPSTH